MKVINKDAVLVVRLDPPVKAELKKEAKRDGVRLSDYVRKIISERLKK